MAFSQSVQSTLLRYQSELHDALQRSVTKISDAAPETVAADLRSFYGQIEYQLGWVDADFTPVSSNPGKYLRPTLLLLAYEVAGAWGLNTSSPDYLRRALPAAVSVELTHNFTLIHDDIEDGDTERRHRATLWKLWGIPHAINTGDGLFALARLTLWDVLDAGVEGEIAARLGAVLDRACLILSEGQHLDLSFERQELISAARYVDMIRRKTGALMGCATEMGAMLGTQNQQTIALLRDFGVAIGIAFQVRDDLLGVWATTAELGKTPSGDVYRRKKSLPILHALEHANAEDQKFLHEVYQQEMPVTPAEVDEILAIFDRTETQAYCRAFLTKQCRLAYERLASVPQTGNPAATRALNDMQTLVHFVGA